VELEQGQVVYVWVPRHVTDGALDGATVSYAVEGDDVDYLVAGEWRVPLYKA